MKSILIFGAGLTKTNKFIIHFKPEKQPSYRMDFLPYQSHAAKLLPFLRSSDYVASVQMVTTDVQTLACPSEH